MVKIAIAGGTGEVAREIIDALIAAEKHEVLLLTRKEVSGLQQIPNTIWIQADYADKEQLTRVLQGVDTVLSFVTPVTDPGNQAQKNLIDASVAAGVRRFAPSEWATSSFEHMPFYAGKGEIREYLKAVNRDKQVLEYSLFQPGLFVNYLAHPYKTAKHVNTFLTQFDFENRRAIIPAGCEDVKMTLTAAEDLANVVVKAIEYEDKWPVEGGIRGCEISLAQIIQLGEEIRAGPFTVDKLQIEDLKAGVVNSSWMPLVDHAAIPPEQARLFSGMFLAAFTLGISVGALNVVDDWNRLFPEYKFIQPKQFLAQAWEGKP